MNILQLCCGTFVHSYMSLKKIIAYEVPTLEPTYTAEKILQVMEENNLQQLPVVANEQYIALLREDDLLDWETPEKPISSSDFMRFSPAVFSENHPYDALKLAYNQNLSVVPVIDQQNNYVGAATRETILNFMAENSGLENPGGIIVLEMKPLDYSLYEIARICESEDVTIISTQLYTNKATGNLELTIKTNRASLDGVAGTYERFGYTVKELYGEHTHKDDLIDRYNLLMAYINM